MFLVRPARPASSLQTLFKFRKVIEVKSNNCVDVARVSRFVWKVVLIRNRADYDKLRFKPKFQISSDSILLIC